MYLKRPATQKITMGEFARIAADLERRGFVEEPKKTGQGIIHEMMAVASYRREMSDFVLRVGASQEASDMIAASRGELAQGDMGAMLWAECSAEADRKVAEFAKLLGHKSHHVDMSRNPRGYRADLVPLPDPSILIDGCLRLASIIARIRSDREFAAAIDAKEVWQKMAEAQGQVRKDNSYTVYLGNYLGPLFDSLKKKSEYEYSRIMQDPIVMQALAQVADK